MKKHIFFVSVFFIYFDNLGHGLTANLGAFSAMNKAKGFKAGPKKFVGYNPSNSKLKTTTSKSVVAKKIADEMEKIEKKSMFLKKKFPMPKAEKTEKVILSKPEVNIKHDASIEK